MTTASITLIAAIIGLVTAIIAFVTALVAARRRKTADDDSWFADNEETAGKPATPAAAVRFVLIIVSVSLFGGIVLIFKFFAG